MIKEIIIIAIIIACLILGGWKFIIGIIVGIVLDELLRDNWKEIKKAFSTSK